MHLATHDRMGDLGRELAGLRVNLRLVLTKHFANIAMGVANELPGAARRELIQNVGKVAAHAKKIVAVQYRVINPAERPDLGEAAIRRMKVPAGWLVHKGIREELNRHAALVVASGKAGQFGVIEVQRIFSSHQLKPFWSLPDHAIRGRR